MFIVLEIQKQIDTQTTEETASVVSFIYSDRSTAENKYHTVLAYAAVSSVPVHSAIMIDEFGTVIKIESYTHDTETIE